MYVTKLVKENYFNFDTLTDFIYSYNSEKLPYINTVEKAQDYLIEVLLDNPDVKASKQAIKIYNEYFRGNGTSAREFFDKYGYGKVVYSQSENAVVILNN
jgi:hypothetical protein